MGLDGMECDVVVDSVFLSLFLLSINARVNRCDPNSVGARLNVILGSTNNTYTLNSSMYKNEGGRGRGRGSATMKRRHTYASSS